MDNGVGDQLAQDEDNSVNESVVFIQPPSHEPLSDETASLTHVTALALELDGDSVDAVTVYQYCQELPTRQPCQRVLLPVWVATDIAPPGHRSRLVGWRPPRARQSGCQVRRLSGSLLGFRDRKDSPEDGAEQQ
ncbi:hypothetical protein GCM10010336_62990 [Streptomyces goshikiensis]|nr:hypothetical protein GCM10010336_62990 [Streptomyces goshikiensis]